MRGKICGRKNNTKVPQTHGILGIEGINHKRIYLLPTIKS